MSSLWCPCSGEYWHVSYFFFFNIWSRLLFLSSVLRACSSRYAALSCSSYCFLLTSCSTKSSCAIFCACSILLLSNDFCLDDLMLQIFFFSLICFVVVCFFIDIITLHKNYFVGFIIHCKDHCTVWSFYYLLIKYILEGPVKILSLAIESQNYFWVLYVKN